MPAWILDQWPRVWGGFVYVSFLVWGACAGLTPALWADWLLIPWCVFRLCSHSYCIYGCVSVHLTNHTHSYSLCLCLPSSHFQNSTLQLSYCHFILLLKAQRQFHHQISGVAFMCACVCQCVNDTPRFWQLYGTACDEQQQGETLWCFFSSLSLVAPPLLLSWLWSLHSGAEISVFHRVGHRQCAR